MSTPACFPVGASHVLQGGAEMVADFGANYCDASTSWNLSLVNNLFFLESLVILHGGASPGRVNLRMYAVANIVLVSPNDIDGRL